MHQKVDIGLSSLGQLFIWVVTDGQRAHTSRGLVMRVGTAASIR